MTPHELHSPTQSARDACYDQTIRVGAVSYLNSRPLIVRLFDRLPEGRVTLGAPSALAESLLAGELDVALIPSIEFARHPELQIASNACVACAGPVRSVMVYGRVPPERVRTLGLDEGSRTSAALSRIILAERYGVYPDLIDFPLDAELADCPADAVVVIGDRGLIPAAELLRFVWDLGAEWHRWQKLPFVFAFWAAREGVANGKLAAVLNRARDEGVGRLPAIAVGAARRLPLAQRELLDYLRRSLRFRLGPGERKGLRQFYRLAAKHGLAPEGRETCVDIDHLATDR